MAQTRITIRKSAPLTPSQRRRSHPSFGQGVIEALPQIWESVQLITFRLMRDASARQSSFLAEPCQASWAAITLARIHLVSVH